MRILLIGISIVVLSMLAVYAFLQLTTVPECKNLVGSFVLEPSNSNYNLTLRSDESFTCNIDGIEGDGIWDCSSVDGFDLGTLVYDDGDKIFFHLDNSAKGILDGKMINGNQLPFEMLLTKLLVNSNP